MKATLPVYPFEAPRYIGTVVHVGPSWARVNLPHAGTSNGIVHHGARIAAGEVGEFSELTVCGISGGSYSVG